MQLRTAIASQRAEGIAGQAFRVHAHQHRFAQIAGVAFDQRHMLAAIELVGVTDGLKGAEFSGEGALGGTHHKTFVLQPVANQVFNADQLQPFFSGVNLQFRKPGHGTVRILDFADHTRGVETRHLGKINGGFGMTCALEHATGTSPQRKNMAWTAQIGRFGAGLDCHLDRARSVIGRDPR